MFIQQKQSIRSSDRGFTIFELLVAASLGLLVSGIALSTVMVNNRAYKQDIRRVELSQNLANAISLLGANIRETGENLSSTFPAVLLQNGASGGPDTLTIRKNVADEVLKLCNPIAASSSDTLLNFADSSTEPGCSHTDNTYNYSAWQSYRTAEGGSMDGYLYDSGSRQGEFFVYTAEQDDGANLEIQTSSGTWANSYPVGTSAIYLLEEWELSLNSDTLQLIWNDDTTNQRNIVAELDDFQVSITLSDGSTVNTFAASDDWTEITAIEVSLTGSKTFGDQTITVTRTGSYYPRNILSN